jgi:hypothetical protein
MSIYIEKHPGSVSGMLKYMEVVREIAREKEIGTIMTANLG